MLFFDDQVFEHLDHLLNWSVLFALNFVRSGKTLDQGCRVFLHGLAQISIRHQVRRGRARRLLQDEGATRVTIEVN